MSYSNEWWEYHLTPNGWVNGSEKLDFGNVQKVEPPKDRVLTKTRHETLSSPYAKPKLYATIDFKIDDDELIKKLIEKHGEGPTKGLVVY